MRRFLEFIYHKLDSYLWDDETRWELECEVYELKDEITRLEDSVEYYKDVIDNNETLRRY